MEVHNPWEEAGTSGIQRQPGIHREVEIKPRL